MKRLLLALPAVAIVLTGCTPFHAGAAATVGSTRISTSQLRGIVDRGVAVIPSGQKVDRTSLERTTLGQLVQLQVLQALAAELHVTVSAQDVDAVITQAAQQGGLPQLQQRAAAAGIDQNDLQLYARTAAYQNKIVGALPVDPAALQAAYTAGQAQFTQVHVALILLDTAAQGQQVAKLARANPASFGKLALQYSTDATSKVKGGDLGFISPGGNLPKAFSDAAFAGRDGSIVGPVDTGSGFAVIHIIEHKTVPLAQAESTLRPQLVQAEFLRRYQATEARLRVDVNPRFGTWQASAASGLGAVGAATGDLSIPVPTAK
ncbi:MAG TPA: peptidylprolyl isomerase [Mycobacteriales bacterium]|nr:peptidylprolyl isomerase [Mycobacteriales bacterium]